MGLSGDAAASRPTSSKTPSTRCFRARRDHHARPASALPILRHKIGVEPVSGIRNGRDCDASKHFLCHTVSLCVIQDLFCDVRVDILCGELTGSDLVDGRGDRLFAEGITLFVGLLGDLAARRATTLTSR